MFKSALGACKPLRKVVYYKYKIHITYIQNIYTTDSRTDLNLFNI